MKTYHVKFQTTIAVDADSKEQAREVAGLRMNAAVETLSPVDDECELISCRDAPTDEDEGINLVIGSAGYNETVKARFKKEAMALLRQVAQILERDHGLEKGTYDLRYNAGGIAVSGDATLHANAFYVTFNLDISNWVLVRTCTSRRDYTGGPNRQYSFDLLAEEGAEGLAAFIMKVVNPCTA